MIQTALTELLGCRYPIIQTAMGWVSGPQLVAATANAGGFGFLAGATIEEGDMEANLLAIKKLTEHNFGVNFHMYQTNASDIVDMVIEHKVKAVSYSRSPVPELIERLKANNVLCIPTIGLNKHARKAIELGADALVVQGSEGGGHTGAVPTSLLLPQVVASSADYKVPIAAAGGFADGHGLIAAMAWGADGIAMGTRFLMTEESMPPDETKQQYINCKNPALIYRSTALDGLPQRMINNPMLQRIENSNVLIRLCIALVNGLRYKKQTGSSFTGLLSAAWKMSRTNDMTFIQAMMSANAPMIIQQAMVEGEPDNGVLPAGQVAAVIDSIVPCEQLITSIIEEATLCLKRLPSQ